MLRHPPRARDSRAEAPASCGTPAGGRMQMNVDAQPGRETRAPGQQPAGQIHRHAVEERTEQLMQPHVGVAHERQRRHVEFTELAVGDPWRAGAERLERQRVDPDRPACLELHVVRRRVLQRHAARHCRTLKSQRQQRRILQL